MFCGTWKQRADYCPNTQLATRQKQRTLDRACNGSRLHIKRAAHQACKQGDWCVFCPWKAALLLLPLTPARSQTRAKFFLSIFRTSKHRRRTIRYKSRLPSGHVQLSRTPQCQGGCRETGFFSPPKRRGLL